MLKVFGVGLAFVVAIGMATYAFMPTNVISAEEAESKATTYVIVVEGMS